MTAALNFCGRQSELAYLIERWKLASNVENPVPQLVLLKAEPGVGKTRLALEFYRWLSTNVDSKGNDGYWPDALTIIDKNLSINPELSACNFSVPIPYLWWGIRAGDIGDKNSLVADAVASHQGHVQPHLLSLLLRSQVAHGAISLFKIWRDVGVDFAANALQVDSVLSVGKGLFETYSLLKDKIEISSGRKASGGFNENLQSQTDKLLASMDEVFNPSRVTFAKVPVVILLDDAQFTEHDPSLSLFVQKFLALAMEQKWPVMILATHWPREYNLGWNVPAVPFTVERNSFAQIVKYARGLSQRDGRVADDRGFGCVKDANFSELDVPVVPCLSEALIARFPGLTASQREKILERVGGNPRFLEQLMSVLTRRGSWFASFDQQGPLSEAGLQCVLNVSSSIHDVVAERFCSAPLAVQEAICLASLQGIQFSPSIVSGLGSRLLHKNLEQPLLDAEHPYSIVSDVSSTEQSGRFSERLFYEVATDRRKEIPELADEIALNQSFKALLREEVERTGQAGGNSTRLHLLRLVSNVFSISADEVERRIGFVARRELASLERTRGATEAADMVESSLTEMSRDFLGAWAAAGNHIQGQVAAVGPIGGNHFFGWLKRDPYPPFMEHLSFRLGNQIFFVRVVDADNNIPSPGSLNDLIAIAQLWKGHACILPLRRTSARWNPVSVGWNLFDAITLVPVDPMELITDEPVEMTEWEIHSFAVQVVAEHCGMEVLQVVPYLNAIPSIWIKGAFGPEAVIVTATKYPAPEADKPLNAERIRERLKASGATQVHHASVALASENMSSLGYLERGKGAYAVFTGFEPL